MDEQIELLREMRDLLRVMAEPALAERDKKLRAALIEAVGNSKKRAQMVPLLDGSRTQSDLHKATGLDPGNVSRFVRALREKHLIKDDEKHPELVISVPPNFFERYGEMK
jgi:hypothetical protein